MVSDITEVKLVWIFDRLIECLIEWCRRVLKPNEFGENMLENEGVQRLYFIFVHAATPLLDLLGVSVGKGVERWDVFAVTDDDRLSTSISHLKCSHAFNAFAVTHLAKITARLSGHDSVLILAFSFIDTVNIVFSSASFKEYATYHKLLRTQMCVFDPHFDSQWKVVIILIRRSESSSRWLQKKIRRPINNVGLNRRRVFFFVCFFLY